MGSLGLFLISAPWKAPSPVAAASDAESYLVAADPSRLHVRFPLGDGNAGS
jgi:hypothetical protein